MECSDELRRLEHKMDTLEVWLRANPEGTPLWVKRQDVWFSAERKYRQVFDAINSGSTPHHEQEAMKL